MTVLVWMHHPDDGVVALTDTLACSTDGTALAFVSKCFPFPHLELMMFGTGLAAVVERFAWTVHSRAVLRDAAMLDKYAPDLLRRVYTDLRSEIAGRDNIPSATVYVFGRTESGFVRYTYRSRSEFASECDTGGGFGAKPEPLGGLQHGHETVEAMIDLAVMLKAEDERVGNLYRVGIGGDLILSSLSRAGVTQRRVRRFDDFEDHWKAAMQQLVVDEDEPAK